jgi:hypothetical protein
VQFIYTADTIVGVDDLANLLSIPWDPSEMVIVDFVPTNVTVSEGNISFQMEEVSTW